MILIFISSSIPGNSPFFQRLLPNAEINNLLHIPEYGILTYLWIRYFFKKKRNVFLSLKYSAIISFVYGISEEFHQSMVVYRTASVGDIMRNTIGIII